MGTEACRTALTNVGRANAGLATPGLPDVSACVSALRFAHPTEGSVQDAEPVLEAVSVLKVAPRARDASNRNESAKLIRQTQSTLNRACITLVF